MEEISPPSCIQPNALSAYSGWLPSCLPSGNATGLLWLGLPESALTSGIQRPADSLDPSFWPAAFSRAQKRKQQYSLLELGVCSQVPLEIKDKMATLFPGQWGFLTGWATQAFVRKASFKCSRGWRTPSGLGLSTGLTAVGVGVEGGWWRGGPGTADGAGSVLELILPERLA